MPACTVAASAPAEPLGGGGEGELRALALAALARAYAPYSHFPVGAAVRGGSGAAYVGANVENASYGLTICAERSAVVQAVMAGERRLLACATASERGSSVPCGACRQVLAEFCDPDAPVHYLVDGGAQTRPLSALLPGAFALDRPGV